MDCQSYNNYTNIDDFSSEYGYNKPSQAIKVYRAVKKNYLKLEKLFNDSFEKFLQAEID